MTGERDEAILDLLPEAVVVVDADGAVERVNERARSLLGLGEEALGAPLTHALDLRDDAGEYVTDGLVPADRGVSSRLAERVLRAHLADGRSRAVSVAGGLFASGGAVLTFRHAGRRERLEALRSDLVATVSHEIRSPLASVKGFTRTMLQKWERFSDEQKRQMLETIDADADRVTRLLTELLDVARIDAGRVRLDRRPVEVGAVVRRVVGKLTHVGDRREIAVDVDEAPPEVHADPDKLEQVVTNLVDNALRHAPGSPVELTVTSADTEVRIDVRDEGPGIPPEHQRQIFEKFAGRRGDRRAGTGLGLYITKGLVEAHGGRVAVRSTPGQGTTFTVVLPAAEAEPAVR